MTGKTAAFQPARSPDRIRTGLVGRGIQGSRSPAMHTREAQALGLNLSYELFDLDAAPWNGAALADVIDHAEAQGLAGVNVTYPFKQDVIPLLTNLSPEAERLGAVNTVVFARGRRTGHNTDCFGFGESLRRGLPDVSLEVVLQVGAGGAGAAVAYALLSLGARTVLLHDLDLDRASDLTAKMSGLFPDRTVEVVGSLAEPARIATGFVNASPMGMAKYPGAPIPPGLLRQELWVADVVYVPLQTELLTQAQARGCRTLDGGGMAVFQAAEAFRHFTGRQPDADRMRSAFLEDLKAAP